MNTKHKSYDAKLSATIALLHRDYGDDREAMTTVLDAEISRLVKLLEHPDKDKLADQIDFCRAVRDAIIYDNGVENAPLPFE